MNTLLRFATAALLFTGAALHAQEKPNPQLPAPVAPPEKAEVKPAQKPDAPPAPDKQLEPRKKEKLPPGDQPPAPPKKEKAPPSGDQPPPEKKAPSVEPASPWAWSLPTSEVEERLSRLSPPARKKLHAAFNDNAATIARMSLAEYNAFFQQQATAIIREDEAHGMSTGGVPKPFFREQRVGNAPKPVPPAVSAGSEGRRRGPPPQDVERYQKLSDAAKDKLRKTFEANRTRIMDMSPEDRRAFMEKTFKTVADEDEASRK